MVPETYTKPQNICDLAKRLASLGYYPVPIPAGCKGPTIAGWQKLRLTPEDCDEYFPERGALVGVLHVNLLAIDIDVYDAELAETITAEAFKRFPGALERVGQAPKSAMFFRMDEPGFKVSNTEKLEKDGKSAQVEIRSVSRQIVAYGVHPDTNKPYTWPRGELWATPRDELPVADRAEIEQFRDWCADQIRKWAGVSAPNVIDIDLYPRGNRNDERPTPEAFRDALSYVSPSSQYDEWLHTLMAIHDYYGGSSEGLQVAQDWSSPYPHYTPHEVRKKWLSFEVGKGTSYRTVFHLARLAGADLRELARKHKPAPEQPAPMTSEEREVVPAAMFRPWVAKDLSAIPSPEFVYSDFYARGYTSLTLAAPKVGKSMLGLAEALDMATGRGILTGYQRDPLRVVYYNAEDDQDVIDARVAALLTRYGIDQSELVGTFWPTSGVDADDFFLVTGQEGIINEPLFVGIEKFIAENSADVLIFDPLQDLSRSPETNEVFRLLGQRLRRLATTTGVALGLIHHTRKVAPGMTATIDDARGGSALRGTARFNRILLPMTEEEGLKAGVENHRHFFRIGDMESNLAPPSADVNRWFEKVSVETPSGEHIGAVAAWKWPDAFNGITPQQAAQVRGAIDRMAEPPSESIKANAWAGHVVGEILGISTHDKDRDKAGRMRIQQLIRGWVATDVLREETVYDKAKGRDKKIIIAGANDPLVTGGQSA